WQQALREIAPAVAVSVLAQIDAGEVQQIEAVEDDGRAPVRAGDLPRAFQLDAVLQRIEGWLAGLVQRDDLAVEDHAADRLPPELPGEPRKRGRELEPAPRAHADLLPVDECEHAVAVELRLPR